MTDFWKRKQYTDRPVLRPGADRLVLRPGMSRATSDHLYKMNAMALDERWPAAERAGAERVARDLIRLIQSRSRPADQFR